MRCKATAIDEALFTLQVGQMSPILDSDDGFHIVRVLERKEAGRKPFTEVQPDIRDKLKDERFQAGIGKYLAKLRRDARIWTAFTGNMSADVLWAASRMRRRRGSVDLACTDNASHIGQLAVEYNDCKHARNGRTNDTVDPCRFAATSTKLRGCA